MRVHLSDPGSASRLAALVGESCALTDGVEVPPDSEVLVDGSPAEAVLQTPALRAVVVPWAGVSETTLARVRARPGLKLYNLHHNAAATAEMALALLLAAARGVPWADHELRHGRWADRQEGPKPPAIELHGKTVCILGYGAIGRHLGGILTAMGMEVLAVSRLAKPGVFAIDELDGVLARASALVVCAPLTDETRGLIDRRRIHLLQAPRLVVNVGRGAIFVEEDLYRGCAEGDVAGAGLDVWYLYPRGADPQPPSRFPFHELPHVVLSPHRAGHTDRAESQRWQDLADLLRAIDRGDAKAVDLERGY